MHIGYFNKQMNPAEFSANLLSQKYREAFLKLKRQVNTEFIGIKSASAKFSSTNRLANSIFPSDQMGYPGFISDIK